MSTDAASVEISINLRHVDPPESAREYALDKLSPTIYAIPNLMAAGVEITFESAAAPDDRYVMDVTAEANGSMFRVVERGPDVESVTNTVYDTLDRQVRDWKEEVYFEGRKASSAAKEDQLTEAASLPPDRKDGLIIRKESQEIKPMFVEDAAVQLEESGLEFLFFLNAESIEYNVVYHRKDGGYGWIVPSFTEIDDDVPAEEVVDGGE
jgi:putative sigma-54 modulation protein